MRLCCHQPTVYHLFSRLVTFHSNLLLEPVAQTMTIATSAPIAGYIARIQKVSATIFPNNERAEILIQFLIRQDKGLYYG
jgi:hypothetical protein